MSGGETRKCKILILNVRIVVLILYGLQESRNFTSKKDLLIHRPGVPTAARLKRRRCREEWEEEEMADSARTIQSLVQTAENRIQCRLNPVKTEIRCCAVTVSRIRKETSTQCPVRSTQEAPNCLGAFCRSLMLTELR